jgi:hypothetical protein
MKLIRSGQSQSLQVTPAQRTAKTPVFTQWQQDIRLWDPMSNSVLFGNQLGSQTNRAFIIPSPLSGGTTTTLGSRTWVGPPSRDARAELAELVKEVRKLNQRIEALERSLTAAGDRTEKQAPKKDK